MPFSMNNAVNVAGINKIPNKYLKQSNFKLIKLKKNYGSATGRNRGVALAKGKYLLFFDFDTVLDKNCLKEFAKFVKKYPKIGALHGKLLNLQQENVYDYAGDYLDPFGFLVDRALGAEDIGQFDFVAPILGGKAACMLVPKSVFKKIGGYDESYFFLLEEADFYWRTWLAGYPVLFTPKSVARHAFNTSKKREKDYYDCNLIKYLGARNYSRTLFKNLGTRNLIRILPLNLHSWFAMSLFFLVRLQPTSSYFILKGLASNLLDLPTLAAQRKKIQKERKLTDKELSFLFIKRQALKHYIKKILSYLNLYHPLL